MGEECKLDPAKNTRRLMLEALKAKIEEHQNGSCAYCSELIMSTTCVNRILEEHINPCPD